MIKLKENKFDLQYSELNIKQRLFEGNSYITLELKTSFYPTSCEEGVVFGSVDVIADCELNGLEELQNSVFKEGKVVFNLNENGNWKTYNFDKFKLEFLTKTANEIKFELELDECEIKESCHITSLYTVGNKDISKYFSLDGFNPKPVIKEITNKQIYKYFTN